MCKKTVKFILLFILLLSTTVFSENTTTVTYTGEGTEWYKLTVPSSLSPGDNGTVILEGTWPSDRKVVVTADETVDLQNDINNTIKTLDIGFNGIEQFGDNYNEIYTTENISVANIGGALFGNWSGTFYYNVDVKDKIVGYELVPLEDILGDDGKAYLNIGEQTNLNAVAVYSEGESSWSSSNSEIVSVTSGGLATAIGPGTATITYSMNGFEGELTFIINSPLSSISLNKSSLTLEKGFTDILTVFYSPSNTTDDKEVLWSSSDSGIVSVSNGVLTANDWGTATITANVNGKKATCEVTVPQVLNGISLNANSITLENGETYQLEATSSYRTVYDWSSSDDSVATVDNDGLVIAVGPGSTTITVRQGDFEATCIVTVTQKLNGISLNKSSITLNVGNTETLAVTYIPSNTTDNKNVTWVSSDNGVATVTNGLVTAISDGTAIITATVGSYSKNCDITVVRTFSDYSWSEIITACKANTVPSTWAIGDSKPMTINGETYNIQIIGKNHDTYSNGGTAPLTFQLVEVYTIKAKMNEIDDNTTGWKNSQMRISTLPTILTKMPSEVRSAIKAVDKQTTKSDMSGLETTSDKLFLLSEYEVFGRMQASKNYYQEGKRYAFYTLTVGTTNFRNIVNKYLISGEHSQWWLRSVWSGSSYDNAFCTAGNGGGFSYYKAADDYGISFAFCF